MKEKRVSRALKLAVICACVGLFWCLAVFFALWGQNPVMKLLPFVLFAAALAAAIPVAVIVGRKR